MPGRGGGTELFMLRGVNRQIIEVSETKNEYFERAILFVRPEYISENEANLRNEANKTVGKLLLGSVRLRGAAGGPKVRLKKGGMLIIGLSCLAGSLFTAAVFLMAYVLG
jgi:hypothetical protein